MNKVAVLTQQWAKDQSIPISFLDECPSTNTWALNETSADPISPSLFLSAHQSQGRGRGERSWLSTDQKDALYSSWVFWGKDSPQPILSPLIGWALFDSARSIWPTLPWSLKAPNDLFLADKKVAGLLIENQLTGRDCKVVIGLGMNIFSSPTLDRQTAEFDAGHLTSFTSDFDASLWSSFLDHLIKGFKEALELAKRNAFREVDRVNILSALQEHPTLGSKIADLSPKGDLLLDQHWISWLDL